MCFFYILGDRSVLRFEEVRRGRVIRYFLRVCDVYYIVNVREVIKGLSVF